MSNQEFILLAEKVASGEANDQELLSYTLACDSFEEIPLDLKDIIDELAERQNVALTNFWKSQEKKRSINLWQWAAIAAALAIIISSVGIYLTGSTHSSNKTNFAEQADVVPGKYGATLTLASGEKIRLGDASVGKIATEGGIKVTKSSDGQLVYEVVVSEKDKSPHSGTVNTLTTARGEMYIVKLPDNSKIWLNADSKLSYATNLNSEKIREVKLLGEAYFEISKDKHRPFIVKTESQEVEVLGTHFNVNAYNNEPYVKTTLLEGSVRVNKELTLRPGEQSVMDNSNQLYVKKVNVENAVDWKNGDFIFDNSSLEEISNEIARWYNVTIIYEDGVDTQQIFGGKVSRKKPISAVLNSLKSTGDVKYKLEGNKVIFIK